MVDGGGGVVDEEGEGFGGLFNFGLDCVEIQHFFIGLDER